MGVLLGARAFIRRAPGRLLKEACAPLRVARRHSRSYMHVRACAQLNGLPCVSIMCVLCPRSDSRRSCPLRACVCVRAPR